MRISDDFLSELKYRNDLSEIAANYVQLKRRGRNLVGLCPFHGEKTPSFNIYTENGSFYCFGCGAGGDVITFIMKIENLDYIEAVRFLAQRAGMSMPEDSVDDSLSKLRTRVYEANREAARFFYQKLNAEEGRAALDYLHRRELSNSTIRHFGLGYAPNARFALTDHLRKKGFTDAELVAANLVFKARSGKGVVDRFYDRVMFPIIDLRGNVIAFGGRIMSDQKPKYLNTSDTVVFSKSNNLFSLNNAKNAKEKYLILCEGYMDVIALNQAGFPQAVATLGTALTEEQALLMKRYCEEVVICYDADEAGQKATSRAIGILRRVGLPARVLTVPDGKDPDEFIRNHGDKGPAIFRNILNNSYNDVDYRLNKLQSAYDMNLPQSKMRFLNEAVKIIATLDNPMERDIYCSKISDVTDVSKESIKEQTDKLRRQKRREESKAEFKGLQNTYSGRSDRMNPQRQQNLRAVRAEESLLSFLVKNPDKRSYINSRLSPDDFVTDFNRKLYIYFSDRIKDGYDPMLSISADFTADEISVIMRITKPDETDTDTMKALDEYIKIIKEEHDKPSEQEIKDASLDDWVGMFGKEKDKRQ
ncbi:MAG: DNA primase [Ruminococcus sp.]|nr:DNA primase [Ruminococcus sp.]